MHYGTVHDVVDAVCATRRLYVHDVVDVVLDRISRLVNQGEIVVVVVVVVVRRLQHQRRKEGEEVVEVAQHYQSC